MRWKPFALAVLGLSLVATAAWAAGGGHGGDHHLNWWGWDQRTPPIGWFMVDFVIFVGLLYWLTKNKVVALFKKRHETIKEALHSAQAEYDRAKSHRDEYQAKLSRVDQEVGALVDGAQDDGKSERERIIEQAKAYAERLRKDTSVAVEQEVRMARRRLHEQEVAEVLRRASEMLERDIDRQRQERLLEDAIVELERGKLQGVGERPDAGGAA